MATRKARKPRTTPEQRAARREADAALIEAASARLDGDEAGPELADYIDAHPALARLSVKNVSLLVEQATERGTTVSDVQTYRGWQTRGRQVRKGAKAYRLIVPRREDTDKADKAADEPRSDGNEGDDKPKRPRFYLKPAWFDVADTEPIAEPVETTDA